MSLVDNREQIEIQVDQLIEILNKSILKLEINLSGEKNKLQAKDNNYFNSTTFFLIHNAFAALVELKSNLKTRSFISATLITRHLLELYADYKLITSDSKNFKSYANAFYYYGQMRNLELNNSVSDDAKLLAKDEWKKYRLGTKNSHHWSGLVRTEIVRMAWDGNDGIYRALSAQSHVSTMTTDLVFWNYSERAIGFMSANVNGAIGMVEEIFDIALYGKFQGVNFV